MERERENVCERDCREREREIESLRLYELRWREGCVFLVGWQGGVGVLNIVPLKSTSRKEFPKVNVLLDFI